MLPLARVLPHLRTTVLGHPLSDVYKHVWPYWHTLAQLSEGTWPHTRYLNAPFGGALLDVMLVPSLLMAPVTAVGGPVLASNVWIGLSLFAVGAATYLLCRTVTGSVAGATTAGLLVQTCPYLLGYVLNSGVHERLTLWAFPLLVLGMHQCALRGGLRWPLLLIPVVGIVTLSSPTQGLMVAALTLGLLPIVLWPSRGRSFRSRLVGLMPALVLLAIVQIGLFLLVRWVTTEPHYLAGIHWIASEPLNLVDVQWPKPSFYWQNEDHGVVHPSTLTSLLNPLAVHRSQPQRLDDLLYMLTYLGWVPLLAIVGGIIVAWKQRRWRTIALVGLGLWFVLASLGPTFGGQPRGMPNPFFLLLAFPIPMFDALNATWHLSCVFWGVSVIAIAHLVGVIGRPRVRWMVCTALVLATLIERALVLPVPLLPPTAEGRVDPIYHQIDGDGAVLDLPYPRGTSAVSSDLMFLAQATHGQPIISAINTPHSWWHPLPELQASSGMAGPQLRCLGDHGFRWIVVHREGFTTPGERDALVIMLSQNVGTVKAATDQAVLFDLQAMDASRFAVLPSCPQP